MEHIFRSVCIFVIMAALCCCVQGFSREEKILSYCEKTLYSDLCIAELLEYDDPIDSISLTNALLRSAIKKVKHLHFLSISFQKSLDLHVPKLAAYIAECVELQKEALDLLHDSQIRLFLKTVLGYDQIADIHTWVSAALTYQTTCKYGIKNMDYNSRIKSLVNKLEDGEKTLSILLSFIASLYSSTSSTGLSSLLQNVVENPMWSRSEHPRWLQQEEISLMSAYPYDVANLVVAADGSGNFTTIAAAIAAAPTKSNTTFVIYIKSGVYAENVEVPKNKTKLMFIGDGINQTIITGNKSVADVNITTFYSFTLALTGNEFLARDITVRNTAGAVNHQAVALRVQSDKSAFFRCSFEGYQDTLYSHSNRQFYRECYICGTIDFIFGNSAAVFQACTLMARIPMASQNNVYTAQGRTDPNQNTGFSFHRCTLDGIQQLKNQGSLFSTYLGRPWQLYSRTVYLLSYESSVINPAGWLPWSGTFALDTLFYGEYLCQGPGSSTSSRVSWSTQINSTIANNFTVANFISGNDWLGNTSFPFDLYL